MTKKFYLILLPVMLLCFACTAHRNMGAQRQTVAFEKGHNYFATGEVQKPEVLALKTQTDFDARFSPAAAMGEGGRPTEVDFAKCFVIGMDFPLTDRLVEVEPVRLSVKEAGVLELVYRKKVGQKQSSTIHPCFFLVVDRQYADYRIVAKAE